MRIDTRAFAKINLFLSVMQRREDGYHDIEGIIVPVSVFDEIEIELSDTGTIRTTCTVDGLHHGLPWKVPLDIPSEHNLATRATLMLRDHLRGRFGAHISILKQIPVAAGLGGGSSDAASVLKALDNSLKLGLAPDELFEMGARLGCDIPAFLQGGPVAVTGKGEKVRPLESRERLWFVLVNPGFAVSTKNIFTLCDSRLTSTDSHSKFHRLVSGMKSGDLEEVASALHNDLEAVAFRKFPIIGMIKEKMIELGAVSALMSGSGASVFALVRDEAHARELEERLPDAIGCPLWHKVVSTN